MVVCTLPDAPEELIPAALAVANVAPVEATKVEVAAPLSTNVEKFKLPPLATVKVELPAELMA